MSFKSRYGYLALAVIQLLITGLVFSHFVRHPSAHMFTTYGDGLKNYFTLQTYVQEPPSKEGLFGYPVFAYPFGDYVFYTDNTPLFSIPFRWFCSHVADISAYAIPAFNFFIISNMLFCGLLSYWVFRRLLGRNVIAFLLAVILPWSSPQLLRIAGGHFNLSLSVLPVAGIALLLLWYRYRDRPRCLLLLFLLTIGFTVAAFLLHGYYMAIITIFVAALLFLYSCFTFRQPGGWQRLLLSALVAPLSVGCILLILQLTDRYLPLRKETAMGYDFGEQKTIYAQLFTHYSHQRVFFPLYSSKSADMLELSSYLGNTGLCCLLFLFLGSLFSRSFRIRLLDIQKDFFADPVKKSIFWSGLLLLLISFGERYTTNKAAYRLSLPFSGSFSVTELIVWGLLATVILANVILLIRRRKVPVPGQAITSGRGSLKQWIWIWLAAAVIIYLMVAQYTVTVINIFNPFWYLHFITNKVEQFRSIARFNWPFFWCFYIWIMYTLVQLYRSFAVPGQRIIICSILLLGGSELVDNGIHMKQQTQSPNIFAPAALRDLEQLHLDYSRYQAILPLPYFIAGSEDYDHTIDDDNDFSAYAMQLSVHSRLPLMACKMSRTPPAFSIQLLDLIANDRMSAGLKERLNARPVLIVADRRLLADTAAAHIPAASQPVARALYFKTTGFVSRHHLVPIDSMGDKLFYSWQPM